MSEINSESGEFSEKEREERETRYEKNVFQSQEEDVIHQTSNDMHDVEMI